MKKLISKMIPLALLVLALCMVSVAASAATVAATPDSVYNKYNADGTVTVDATLTGATEGESMQMVVLAVKADQADSTEDLTTLQAANALASAIVYVDQATVTSGTAKSFTFKPKDNYDEDINVFVSGTDATPVMLSIAAPVTNYTVTFADAVPAGTATEYAAGTSLATITAIRPVEKMGKTFVRWTYADDTAINAEGTLAGNISIKAVWADNFTVASETAYCVDDEVETGVISVKAALVDTAKASSVTKYGFVIYAADAFVQNDFDANKDNADKKVEVEVTAGTLTDAGFFTVVHSIAEENYDKNAIIIPYVAVGETVTWGNAGFYKVGTPENNLGTVENLKAELAALGK